MKRSEALSKIRGTVYRIYDLGQFKKSTKEVEEHMQYLINILEYEVGMLPPNKEGFYDIFTIVGRKVIDLDQFQNSHKWEPEND